MGPETQDDPRVCMLVELPYLGNPPTSEKCVSFKGSVCYDGLVLG